MSELEIALAQRRLKEATQALATAHRIREGMLSGKLTDTERLHLPGVLDARVAGAEAGVASAEFRIAQARFDAAWAEVQRLENEYGGGNDG